MRRVVLCAASCLVCCALAVVPLSAADALPKSARSFSLPFIEAAKKAQPGVVSIKSRLKKAARSWMQDRDEEPLPEDLWERFFGPYERRQRQPQPMFAYGSGFVVTTDGYILTNNHLVKDAEEITVQMFNGNEFPATKVGCDPSTDIAVLKIKGKDLPTLALADSSNVEIGEWVLAIGNPFGLQASVTTGVISAKGRSDLDIVRVEKFFQTDAAINMGNSGGPLINLDGEVIGMNTAIASHTGGYLGIGFTIPSNLLQDVMKELIEHGHLIRGYLGIAMQRIDADLAGAIGLEKSQGALVSEVVPGSPADKAGLQSGDVITEVDGAQVESVGTLRGLIALKKPGQSIALKVIREGKTIELTAEIAQNPDVEGSGIEVEETFGLLLEPVTPELARRYSLEAKSGLLIVQIDPNSQAFQAGLRAGHVILAVNGRTVSSVDEFAHAAKAAQQGGRILLQIKIGPNIRFVPLTIK